MDEQIGQSAILDKFDQPDKPEEVVKVEELDKSAKDEIIGLQGLTGEDKAYEPDFKIDDSLGQGAGLLADMQGLALDATPVGPTQMLGDTQINYDKVKELQR